VHQHIPKAGEPLPVHVCMGVLDGLAQPLTRLRQRLQIAKDPSWIRQDEKKPSRPAAVYSSMRAMQRRTCFR
jgi:hypothetical protein